MKKYLILILFLSFNSSSLAKGFKSQYNFKFILPDGYEIFNKNNLYDIYKFSNKDPLVNLQINLAKKSWKLKMLSCYIIFQVVL